MHYHKLVITEEHKLKKSKLFFIFFYLFIVSNVLCESGCEPTCDPSESIFKIQVEECEHPTCELSHQSQHNYVKDNNSDPSKKKYLTATKSILPNADFEIIFLDVLHHNQTVQFLFNNNTPHQFLSTKRYVVFKRLKVFCS